ncbi:hypothetical protein DRJ48_01970, partial [Candidatus Woesearchaeota archaeon]
LFLLGVIHLFLREFRVKHRLFLPLTLVLVIFCLGFALRLLPNKHTVDIGFFFTEISYLLVYITFAAGLILGQIRYWRLR